MKALDYNYPKVTKVDFAFPTFDSPKALLDEAKKRGFYNANTPSNKLFNEWFYNGLKKLPNFKDGVDREKAQIAMSWVRCYMGSFAPKHEDKEAISALIFDECLDLTDTEETS